ncbi:nuclear transport factor 2 family protein [Arthrobacter sp. zg-Y859]|uniref:Nuclear transport factor 2 family protein n=1 Tax=Arthrobacter jinronghuae TaxID=2964609 RepID=A0ABT1NQJ7_9MICC|nr:nuclear transport factor 2 family protein [Arthrobacter jinronghuae]MCQ1950005.1 nuclear transport factor 2 family protein [Arthrobacter jinronghuae]MCQ1956818.1 nuclear transport factor 2 family protein [Arthrobacter jinronghuae]UWX80148.1 nuclear transport factor 2 family protein [Arthrobacter jinronghuae]
MNDLTLANLLEREHLGWQSLCRGQGGDFYGGLMTPDAVMVLVNGMVLDRSTIAATLNAAPPWTSYRITDEHVVAASTGAAALVYRAAAHRAGQEPFEALMSSVYCLVDGRIRLALYQQTTVTH